MKPAFSPLALLVLSATCAITARGAWVKIDDFQGGTVGAAPAGYSIGNTGSTNGGGLTVIADPTPGAVAGNQVLFATIYGRGATRSLGAASIANNSTGTFHYRIFRTGDGAGGSGNGSSPDFNVGLSDLATTPTTSTNVGLFEVQVNIAASAGLNFQLRDGQVNNTTSSGFANTGVLFPAGQFVNIWAVVNNTTDTTNFYYQRAADPAPILFTTTHSSGDNTFSFRNTQGSPQANALTNLLLMASGSAATQDSFYLDDFYVDPTGQNLTSPLPPVTPTVTALADAIEVGVGGAIAFDPTANDSTNSGTLDLSTLTIVNAPAAGTVAFDPLTQKLVYRHTAASAGGDSFRYRIASTNGAEGEAQVSVTVSGAMRLANTTVTLPLTPPASAGALQVVDAFPGLTIDGMVSLASVPGSPNRLLVASAHGPSTGSQSSVWMIPDTGAATAVKKELFRVDSLCPAPFTRGRGIYSVVAHPGFATNGQLIVCYQGKPDGFPIPVNQIPNLSKNGAPYSNINCTLRVSRFTITPAQLTTLLTSSNTTDLNNTRNAIVASELRYLNLAEQDLYHSIDDCHFDSAGNLYVSFGDEGDQGEPYRNAQFINKDQFSAILRLDIDKRAGSIEPNPHYAIIVNAGTGLANFSVPQDNPFVHTSLGGPWNGSFNGVDYGASLGTVRTEMWAVGQRNPFKFDLDETNGQVEAWVGDVGRDAWEEVTLARKGDNCGWSYWEGSHPSGIAHAIAPAVHRAPEWDYAHTSGNNCVIGGVLYRGSAYAAPLAGKYLFGDHGSGRLWALDPAVSGAGKVQDLGVGTISQVVDFHVDPLTGQVLIAQYQSGKKIYRLKEAPPVNDGFPQLLSETGAFADLATLTPNPGVVPYEPNLKFWSDHADKARWFVIKNTTDQMTYSRNGAWSFPEGQIFIKHFDMELNRSFPGTARQRLETRFLVRNPGGTYGVSYRWNEAGTDATLVGVGGVDFDLAIREGGTENGGNVTGGNFIDQSWHIPSRGECLTCHNPTAGHALSVTTQQLNRAGQLGQSSGNFLELLAQSGYVAGYNDDAATLQKFYRPDDVSVNLEERVRSYFAVNCSYCHQPNTGVVESWDARGHLDIDAMRVLYNLPVSETYHDNNDRHIIPGNKADSLIWNRIQARNAIGDGTFNGYSQMPPLATNVPDAAGIALLSQWIDTFANVAPTIDPGTPASVPITENSAFGTGVAAIPATDPDVRGGQADNNLVTYAITGGNPNGLFSINSVTGTLSINGVLDYETATQHVLEITVTDNFAPNPKSTTHTLTVQVLDVANEDANNNGIPDWWETPFALALTAGGDFDKDGVQDFFEFIGGGDPGKSDIGLGLRYAAHTASPPAGSLVTWRVRNGLFLNQHYFARAAATPGGPWTVLTPASYQIISNTPAAPGFSNITIFVPGGGNAAFFRLTSDGN